MEVLALVENEMVGQGIDLIEQFNQELEGREAVATELTMSVALSFVVVEVA